MYHVMANLEVRFSSLEEALTWCESSAWLYPRVPDSRTCIEDDVTRRICVAPTVEQCFTGIGLLGRFRRCLAANEDAFSYVTTRPEVYPIIILTYSPDEEYYIPSVDEVPDVELTHERWLRYPAEPVYADLVWLTPYSIIWAETNCTVCESVRLLDEEKPFGDHPWLNGKGHSLDSNRAD